MDQFNQQLGQKIRQARVRLGFSQQELADQAGFSAHQIISAIEKGEREIKARELIAMAKALRLSSTELISQPIIAEPPFILWRQTLKQDQRIKEAEFLKHCQDYHDLEQFCSLPTYPELPEKKLDLNSTDYSDIELLASCVLKELDLGIRPAYTLERVLENRYRVKIWYCDLGTEGSAASTVGPFGPAILMNGREAPWRRNYNFAHELFHLITWQSIPVEWQKTKSEIWQKVEKLANAFASYLLIPGDQVSFAVEKCIKDEQINYIDLVKIAREFAVSTEALLYRLLNGKILDKKTISKILDDENFRTIDRASMPGYWHDWPTIPERYVILAFISYKKGKISRTRLAQYLEISLTNLSDFLLKYGLDERQDYETQVRAAWSVDENSHFS